MTFWKLIRRNLRFHARAHLGVVLGAAIGSAALIGALVVGDSVRESLTNMALRRLGTIHFALSSAGSSLRDEPGHAPAEDLTRRHITPWTPRPLPCALSPRWPLQSSALVLPGVVAKQDGSARANNVTVLGVDNDDVANPRRLGDASNKAAAAKVSANGAEARTGMARACLVEDR